MNAKIKRTFRIGMIAFFLSSSFALADNAEDFERANQYYFNQEMVDAEKIYKKLAMQNYLPAQARLGDIFDYTESHELAVGWYIMAAFQGNTAGAFGLGKAYLNGFGIKKDPDQALYWNKLAADKDYLDAIKVMEIAYRVGESSGLPVKVDLKQAEYWKAKKIPLEEARTKEDERKLQDALNKLYEEQQKLKKDIEEAAKKSR
jgi:TPR repeat protein